MKILIWPNPILKQVSETVSEPVSNELIHDMFSAMYRAGGVGLSAIQLGIAKRVFIIDAGATTNRFMICVNPVITAYLSDSVPMNEGCLSLPGQFEMVRRYPKISVQYWKQDLSETVSEVLEGIEAHIFQHEYEHLDGMLFVDRLSSARRSTIMGNLQKLKKSGKI